MDSDGAGAELEFEFFLAQKLGKTVQWIRENVSMAEFVGWSRYYAVKAQREELAQAKAKG